MKSLFVALALTFTVGLAFAGENDPVIIDAGDTPCNLTSVAYNWDFAAGNQGFTTTTCDPTGGGAVWAWGTCNIAGAPGTVWATVLNANYPSNAGEGLRSPAFTVTPAAFKMEIKHYFQSETNYDGGNVTVNGQVIAPVPEGYPVAAISTSTSYYAYCVEMEPGFSGSTAESWVQRCFNLTPFMGQSVQVEFDFGSDSSVTYRGWALAYVKIGSDQVVPVENSTWGRLKDIYR